MREREEGARGRQPSSNQLNHFLQPGENDQIPFSMLFSKTKFNQLYNHMHVIITTLPTTSGHARHHTWIKSTVTSLELKNTTLKSSQE